MKNPAAEHIGIIVETIDDAHPPCFEWAKN